VTRKYLKTASGLAPIAAAALLSDFTLRSFAAMLFGGMIVWIPFWLAWVVR
jgi:hypothetical protein